MFRYLKLNTIVSGEGPLNKYPKKEDICFAQILNNLCPEEDSNEEITNTYYLYVNKLLKRQKDTRKNNLCFLSKKNIYSWLRETKILYSNFTFKIKEEKDSFTIKLVITGPRKAHLLVLTQARFIYEYPQSFHLYGAFILKKHIPNALLNQLMHVIGYTFDVYQSIGHILHSYNTSTKLRTKTFYKQKIKDLYDSSMFLNDIYCYLKEINKESLIKLNAFNIKDRIFKNYKNWSPIINKYIPQLINNYNILKK